MLLYPNPVTGTSRLHIDGAVQGSSLRVYNITGTLVHTYTTGSDIIISNAQYPAGIYIYRFSDNEGNTATGKFEVE